MGNRLSNKFTRTRRGSGRKDGFRRPRPPHWSEESVTPARQRFDKFVGGILERLTQSLDGSVDAVVELDDGAVRPKLLLQLFACNQLTRTLEQHRQKLK